MFFENYAESKKNKKNKKTNFFLNIVLKNEEILPTQSEQAFETMTTLSKAKAFAVIVQKWPEASSL